MCNTNLDGNINQTRLNVAGTSSGIPESQTFSIGDVLNLKCLSPTVVYLLSTVAGYAQLLFTLAFHKKLPPIQGLALTIKRLQVGFVRPDVDSYI